MYQSILSVITFLFIGIPTIQSKHITVPLPSEKNSPPRNLCFTSIHTNTTHCSNWAGTKTWTPTEIVVPHNEDELATYLNDSKDTREVSFKVVGYGHSWAGMYIPMDKGEIGVTVVLHRFQGITHVMNPKYCSLSFDLEGITHVEVMSGTSFVELHETLDTWGLGLSWQSGGIQGLTIGGAISVGYHGSQTSSSSISSVVSSLTVMDTLGQKHRLEEDHHLMPAARLGLGVCGVITRATLPVEPQFYLRRRRWKESNTSFFFSEKLSMFKTTYDRFHYYIHPNTNSVWPMFWEQATYKEEARPCRTAIDQWEDELEKEYGKDGLPLIMRWDNCTDKGYRAYTHAIDMDAQPLWNGEWFLNLSDKEEGDTVMEILGLFQQANDIPDIDVWLHVRYMRGDDIYLHPCYGWEQCVGFELALVARGMSDPLPSAESWYRYFHPFEKYLKAKGGRPHWAKDHTVDPTYISTSGLAVSRFVEECKVLNIGGRQGHHPELL